MSGSQMETKLERPRAMPDTAAAAARYLTRTGNADLLEILGLAGEQPKPRGNCPVCGNGLASHGGCNRRKACREATHRPDSAS